MPARSKRNAKERDVATPAVPASTIPATAHPLLPVKHGLQDPTLSALFAVKQHAVKSRTPATVSRLDRSSDDLDHSEGDEELAVDVDDDGLDASTAASLTHRGVEATKSEESAEQTKKSRRKRGREEDDEPVVAAFMSRLAREADRRESLETAANKDATSAKRPKLENDDKTQGSDAISDAAEVETSSSQDSVHQEDDDDDSAESVVPMHETQQLADEELAKANRTVFLGNVSTDAITGKAARKTLLNHLSSFFGQTQTSDTQHKPMIESIRFRSTPYATAMPKKAAFAKQELMDATTKATNAYAVYSSQGLAREAVARLNGTVVLGRHLRVDEVAHPAKVDHRRCVFVGNLGFVDDESNIKDANEENGEGQRNRGKVPADAEEGLWRTFAKCGKVESVRVIRDSKTRVGKGIAYVQFVDENSVEAALLLNEKKFPPMLPRKLRVSRAKAQKRNAKAGPSRSTGSLSSTSGYQRKVTPSESSRLGRTGKLLGRAAASHEKKQTRISQRAQPNGIQKLESFAAFEGHRARASQGNSGLKSSKHGKKKARTTKRSQAFKAKTKG